MNNLIIASFLFFSSIVLTTSAVDKPLILGLYYESLCPDTRNFVIQQLVPTLQKLNSLGIVNLQLYAFGNANYTINGKTKSATFSCQHGVEECRGNTLQICDEYVSDKIHSLNKNIDFINCMFTSNDWRKPNFTQKVGQECASKLDRNWDALEKCLNGPQGEHLQFLRARETVIHSWIPWVTINRVHTDEIQKRATTNLLKLVCDTYFGSGEKPKECNEN